MLGIVHFIFAIILSIFLEVPLLPLIMGSTIPDIDLMKMSKHRTITHSWIPLILLGLGFVMTNSVDLLAFLIGWASHIVLDLFDRKGVAFFYPSKTFICLNSSYHQY